MSTQVTGFYRFARGVLNTFLPPWIRLRTSGSDNLPRQGGFILVWNHTSQVDPVIACWFVARRGYAVRFAAKIEAFRAPVVGPIFRGLRLVPVDRRSKDPGAVLAHMKQALADGDCIGISPEGTLTQDPDVWPMRLKTGAARLALDTRAPVVPMVMWGPHRILPYAGKFPNLRPRQKVDLTVLPAVDLSDLYSEAGSDDHAAVETATARILAALTAGVADLRGEQPPDKAWDPATKARTVVRQA
ncbi:1-acyl-sn-glycerol-3-phosphate acyltransferase [Schaalia sp. 19OD2882]|uniref:lysophospholipid acyltransferase family protein n=1 Tax=Schaalia sp. 19OD2882 TaxID=2794089 RepID=UPI001C1EAC44|nr:lysophospholipid acyltransferase family protein [Schaalia sp. 19OD2882]QWW19083.1 1-acyl-sn-glycerol-3-phosphate acyltransferase [Schaalia sp. 19OD2882]